jgi:hypothetical protein
VGPVTISDTTDEILHQSNAPLGLILLAGLDIPRRAGDRTRTGDVQLGKLAFYH